MGGSSSSTSKSTRNITATTRTTEIDTLGGNMKEVLSKTVEEGFGTVMKLGQQQAAISAKAIQASAQESPSKTAPKTANAAPQPAKKRGGVPGPNTGKALPIAMMAGIGVLAIAIVITQT